MCDYSLHAVKSRPAKVGDTLTTRDFGTGTRGFSASEDKHVAVCLLPGTELSFKDEVRISRLWPWSMTKSVIKHKTAIFRQINQNSPILHHDALEFPDGQIILLTLLKKPSASYRFCRVPAHHDPLTSDLAHQCLKATFFEIAEHARWHPEITKEVIDAGMTIGTHTWSHKDLA
jgi:Polysaccharide deacetylase